MSVTSCTEDTSPDRSHGSTFTVSIPFGKEHLPSTDVAEERHLSDTGQQHGAYARSIVEEATRWRTSPNVGMSPSETSDGKSSSSGSASSGGKTVDPSTLFFRKTDVVLLVDDNEDMRKVGGRRTRARNAC